MRNDAATQTRRPIASDPTERALVFVTIVTVVLR